MAEAVEEAKCVLLAVAVVVAVGEQLVAAFEQFVRDRFEHKAFADRSVQLVVVGVDLDEIDEVAVVVVVVPAAY